MSELGRFHEVMARFLAGELEASEVQRSLGASRSGEKRIGFYRVLMRRNVAAILNKLHAATANAVGRACPGLWPRVIDELAQTSPPGHADPNRFGEGLSGLLASLHERDPSIPEYLEEIADYEWIRYWVGVVDFSPTAGDVGVERTSFVREYSHSVPEFVNASRTDPVAPLPARKRTVCVVFRHVLTLAAVTAHPSPAELAALARESGRFLPKGSYSPARLDAARSRLVARGIISA